MTSKTLAKKIAKLTLAKKAYDIVILDLRKLTSITDYFVICSADSDTQVKAVADAVMEGLEKVGIRVWHNEGYVHRNWILLDYVDVVTHVFHKDIRKFYNLERLWGDAEFEYVKETDGTKATRHVRQSVRKKKVSQ